MKLTVTHPRILEFYEKNPLLDFEKMNLLFVEMFGRILNDLTDMSSENIQSQILTNIYELKGNINDMSKSIETMHADVITTVTNNVYNKITDLKLQYLEELKMIVQCNTNDAIGKMLETSNETLIHKTNTIINEVIPKNQSNYYTQIQDSIRCFHKSLSDDTRMLMKYIDSNSIKEYINHFEIKSSMMLQNIQQPIYSCIASSEERIKESMNIHNNTHQKMFNEWNEFMKQYKTVTQSNAKNGSLVNTCNLFNISQIHMILNKMYSTSEVVEIKPSYNNNEFVSALSSTHISKETQTFIMKRPNKPRILVQNMEIESNVSEEYINGFVKSVEINGCHGVLLSQKTGIVGKPNYHIEIHNKLLIVYLHNVDYDSEKIKAAMDIIDNLSIRMKEISNNDEYSITIEKELLEEINKEYQMFIQHKETMSNIIKESSKKMFSQLDEFKFPCLDKYLYSKFSTQSQKQGFKCDLCKQFLANNLKALAAHKRGCNRKIKMNMGVSSESDVNIVVATET